MPVASGLPPEAYIGMATQPLETMRPILKAFWDAYATTRSYTPIQRKSELERCMRFGAARLAWSALEQRAAHPRVRQVSGHQQACRARAHDYHVNVEVHLFPPGFSFPGGNLPLPSPA